MKSNAFKYLIHDNTDPSINIALDEKLLKESKNNYFILYINKPCAVIGRNQNYLNEIDVDYADKNNIKIIRRCTGGGTVYHDLGNLNFSFIFNYIEHDKLEFLNHINSFLNQNGINSTIGDRFDLLFNGFKISGTASAINKNRMLFHGTLLYDVNLNHLQNVIKPNYHIYSKGVKSVISNVCNIKEYSKFKNIYNLKDSLYDYLTNHYVFLEYGVNNGL
jgi:lipoate-protein ligase A